MLDIFLVYVWELLSLHVKHFPFLSNYSFIAEVIKLNGVKFYYFVLVIQKNDIDNLIGILLSL